MAFFQCEICGNTFEADAELAVCDGQNVKPRADGEPPQVEGAGHAPTVLEPKTRKPRALREA